MTATIEDKAMALLEFIHDHKLTWKATFGNDDWCRQFGVGSWVALDCGNKVARLADFPEDVEKIYDGMRKAYNEIGQQGELGVILPMATVLNARKASDINNAIDAALKEKMQCFARDIQLNMYGEPGQEAPDYVTALANKHTPLYKRLLSTDLAFKEAAEKLAQMLAHALLVNPDRIVKRRYKQSPVLFQAAAFLIAVAGADLGYNANTIEICEEA
jgi:hypothetical protein